MLEVFLKWYKGITEANVKEVGEELKNIWWYFYTIKLSEKIRKIEKIREKVRSKRCQWRSKRRKQIKKTMG